MKLRQTIYVATTAEDQYLAAFANQESAAIYAAGRPLPTRIWRDHLDSNTPAVCVATTERSERPVAEVLSISGQDR
jgi:hypothetical protein